MLAGRKVTRSLALLPGGTHNLKLVVVVNESCYTLIKTILYSVDVYGQSISHLSQIDTAALVLPIHLFSFSYNHLLVFAYLHQTLLRQTFRHHSLCMGGVSIFHSKRDQTFRQVSPTTFSYKYLFSSMQHIYTYLNAVSYHKKLSNTVTYISADHCKATAGLPLKKQYSFHSKAFFYISDLQNYNQIHICHDRRLTKKNLRNLRKLNMFPSQICFGICSEMSLSVRRGGLGLYQRFVRHFMFLLQSDYLFY